MLILIALGILDKNAPMDILTQRIFDTGAFSAGSVSPLYRGGPLYEIQLESEALHSE
jgi:hypothetical protein